MNRIITEYNKTYDCISLKKKDGIVTITFNNPKKRSDDPPGQAEWEEYNGALELVTDDPEARVVIFTGANYPDQKHQAFHSGGNVKHYYEMAQKMKRGEPLDPEDEAFRKYQSMKRKTGGIPSLRQPTIAMVNGDAIGAGASIVLCCDIAIAADTARFMHGYARIGLSSGGGGEWHWARKVGVRNACYWAFTSKFFSAQEAKEFGIVQEVVPFDDLETRTYELARLIAEHPPLAIAQIKEILYASMDAPLTTIFGYTFRAEHVAYLSDEHAEAISALNEKRKPKYDNPMRPLHDLFCPY